MTDLAIDFVFIIDYNPFSLVMVDHLCLNAIEQIWVGVIGVVIKVESTIGSIVTPVIYLTINSILIQTVYHLLFSIHSIN